MPPRCSSVEKVDSLPAAFQGAALRTRRGRPLHGHHREHRRHRGRRPSSSPTRRTWTAALVAGSVTTSQGTVTTGNTTTPTADTSVVVAVGTVQPRDDRDDHIPRHGRGAVHRHRRRDRQPRHGRARPSCPTSTPMTPDTPAPDDPTTTPIDADPVIVVEEDRRRSPHRSPPATRSGTPSRSRTPAMPRRPASSSPTPPAPTRPSPTVPSRPRRRAP